VNDPTRVVPVPPQRLAGWIERFGARHGELTWSAAGPHAVAMAADGARAEFRLPGASSADAAATATATPADLLAAAEALRDFGLVLVRRGGFAIGLVRDGELAASRCGTRYVQGQTKAGGWSQQRYARRRANQADQLTAAAAAALADVLGPALAEPAFALVRGGDRALVTACLELSGTTERVLPDWLDVPDPRRQVLEDAVDRARAVRIALNALA